MAHPSEVAQLELVSKSVNNDCADFTGLPDTLEKLSPIVRNSSLDRNYRKELSEDIAIWKAICDCLDGANLDRIEEKELRYWRMRAVRGVILLGRNLSVENQQLPQELALHSKVVELLAQVQCQYEEMEIALHTAAYELLYNLTRVGSTFDQQSLGNVCRALSYPLGAHGSRELALPVSLYFLNMVRDDEFLFVFLKHPDADKIVYQFMLQGVIKNHTELFDVIDNKTHDLENLSSLGAIQMSIWSCLVTHASFSPYLERLESQNWEAFDTILRFAQLVVTSSEKWDKEQLTAITVWVFRIFESTASSVEAYIERGVDDEAEAGRLHQKLLVVLDILSVFSKYESIRKFIMFYNGVEILINTLRHLQTHCMRINFTKAKSNMAATFKAYNSNYERVEDEGKIKSIINIETSSIKSTNFPECKSLIIEILGFLTYKNREVQDKCRELHGLELVLSNCVIDDNDPFIKERSIMCIRFLLEDNAENQSFVAQLEAKKAVNDDVLAEAGYEVKIGADGKIGLTKNPRAAVEDKIDLNLT
ncbi:AaceriAAR058Wp [[Ashbya] aceris (nom. inval.)]|nr:AaceriAAR058Wp [[Ashbya] aceris (nom. inval.)]